jgi:very-short-patch-repair endonuclease
VSRPDYEAGEIVEPEALSAKRRAVAAACVDRNPFVLARSMARFHGIKWEKLQDFCNHLQLAYHPFSDLVSDEEWREVVEAWECAQEAFARCGSPIEELFLAYVVSNSNEVFTWERGSVGAWESCRTKIRQQHQLGDYRVDFTFESTEKRVVVELDGHDFHERTKEQATRDKSRDRALTEAGWSVLRFTGSEVWEDPFKSMAEVYSIVKGRNCTPTKASQ